MQLGHLSVGAEIGFRLAQSLQVHAHTLHLDLLHSHFARWKAHLARLIL